jgi:hypothetical protein
MAQLGKMWLRLKEKLLSLGGQEVATPHAGVPVSRLARQGKVFTQPVRLRRGWRHECHQNSAVIWAQDVTGYKLCCGYALADGHWIEHSWVLDADNLIETTYRMQAYFGLALTPEEACRHWYGNFLERRYPGPTAFIRPVFGEARLAG